MTNSGIPDSSQLEDALLRRFSLGDVLGTGGQGTVFLARRSAAPDGTQTGDTVALKIYRDPEQDARVEREIAAMEHVRHRSLAALIEHGTVPVGAGGLRYIAWEYVEGIPLTHRLSQGPLAPALIAAIGRDISGAIQELWQQRRIVHRDVKPANIMLRKGNREAVLIDLGFARHLEEPSLTAYGITYGTPGYMSPEHARHVRQLTCKSDIFALGIVLQECLGGVHPTGGRQDALLRGLRRTAEVSPAAPAALAELVDSMVHPRAVFRPEPADLAHRLSRLAEIL